MSHSEITTKLLSNGTWLAKYKSLEFFANTELAAIDLAKNYIRNKTRMV